MTFDEIFRFVRRTYPTASEVSFTIRPHNMQMTVILDEPNPNDHRVTLLDGTVLRYEDPESPRSATGKR